MKDKGMKGSLKSLFKAKFKDYPSDSYGARKIESLEWKDPQQSREKLRELLELRKDKRYRAGLIQGAVSFGVISNREYDNLISFCIKEN